MLGFDLDAWLAEFPESYTFTRDELRAAVKAVEQETREDCATIAESKKWTFAAGGREVRVMTETSERIDAIAAAIRQQRSEP